MHEDVIEAAGVLELFIADAALFAVASLLPSPLTEGFHLSPRLSRHGIACLLARGVHAPPVGRQWGPTKCDGELMMLLRSQVTPVGFLDYARTKEVRIISHERQLLHT